MLVPTEIRTACLQALLLDEPYAKAARVVEIGHAIRRDDVTLNTALMIDEPAGVPGRPARPELVPPFQVKQRSIHTVPGRAALIHALAHIEFNAIHLALDAVWRYPNLPEAYYLDWLVVAQEEAKHFLLLTTHLQSLNCSYGDLPAHNGLWEMAERTKDDLMARMALVPRTLEARGLDASLPIRNKLFEAGDEAGAAILDIILHDEIGHVAIGNRWYRWLCAQRGLDPIATYAQMAKQYHAPALRPPFNFEARRAAGFDEEELAILKSSETSAPPIK